jgi:hypothetical protein
MRAGRLKRERRAFLIDRETGYRLKAIKARSGLSESEQVRRAIALWFESFEWPIRQQETPQGDRHRLAGDEISRAESLAGSVTS